MNATPVWWRSSYWLALWVLCGCLQFSAAIASDSALTIQGANINVVNGVYVLNAQLVFTVPQSAETAVRDGVTMNLLLQIKFDHVRRWWLDETVAELEQRYALIYHGVSERFLVRNLNSGAQSSFASFDDAIESLKTINELPLLDSTLVRAAVRNEISVHAALDIRSIPRVLGMLLFWVDDFSLKSDWYTWPLKPPNLNGLQPPVAP